MGGGNRGPGSWGPRWRAVGSLVSPLPTARRDGSHHLGDKRHRQNATKRTASEGGGNPRFGGSHHPCPWSPPPKTPVGTGQVVTNGPVRRGFTSSPGPFPPPPTVVRTTVGGGGKDGAVRWYSSRGWFAWGGRANQRTFSGVSVKPVPEGNGTNLRHLTRLPSPPLLTQKSRPRFGVGSGKIYRQG